MPKVKWKAFLEGKQKLNKDAKRNMRYEIRKRARRDMQELTYIMAAIEKASKNPNREYALIFKDEKVYHTMNATLLKAYTESYKSTLKLYLPENLDAIIHACGRAGIPIHSRKQLSDRHFRLKVLHQLNQKKTEDGMSWLEWMQEYVIGKRFDKHTI